MAKIQHYDKDEILGKDFQIVDKGYNPQEVDRLLDAIASDYEYFQNQLDALSQAFDEANQANSELTNQIETLKNSIAQKVQKENKQTRENFGNIDMVKRIASIEKELFELKGAIQSLVQTIPNNLVK